MRATAGAAPTATQADEFIKLARAGWQVLQSVAVGSLVQQWHAVRLSASLAHS